MEQDKLLVNLALGKVKEKAEGIFAEHTILDIELKSYHNAETKNMLKRLKRSTRRGKLLLKEFKEFKKNVWKAIRKDKSEVFLWQGEAKSRIPVALTHCGYIHITNLGKTYRVFAAIVIMPVAAGSIILICSPAKFKRQINYIIGSFRQKGYLDHFIFSTLASLTDNWLVNPEFWDNDLAEDAIKELLGKRNWEQPD